MTAIFRDVLSLRAQVRAWKALGEVVAVVPTMGALHAGHISLVEAAKRDCGRVIVTIFVNPKQFNNLDDLARYPRTEAADLALLDAVGVDALFAPPPAEVYPQGFASTVSISGVSEPLEGAHRPGHFDGVATVVAKLFGMTMADRAYFGEKDWQQLQLVRRLVADLNIPVTVVGCETLRETDGLALSSRNARLSEAGRKVAPALHQAMTRAVQGLRLGLPMAAALQGAVVEVLAAGFDRVDYIELRDAESLQPLAQADRPARLLAAAWLDGVRLIDNIGV